MSRSRKGQGNFGTVIVISALAFVTLTWSVNNPNDARAVRDACVSTATDVCVFVRDLFSNNNHE